MVLFMKKDFFSSDIMHFCLLLIADLQAEYPEMLECILAFSHMAEDFYKDLHICKLPEYWHLCLDLLFKG